MTEASPVLLFIGDRPVLASLEFALSLDGFAVADGTGQTDPSVAACLVVDQGYQGDGAAFVAGLRQRGCTAPAILLVANLSSPARPPTTVSIGTRLVEKPLLGDELAQALRDALKL